MGLEKSVGRAKRDPEENIIFFCAKREKMDTNILTNKKTLPPFAPSATPKGGGLI